MVGQAVFLAPQGRQGRRKLRWRCKVLAVFFNLNLLRASPQTRTQRAFFQRCRVQESIFNV